MWLGLLGFTATNGSFWASCELSVFTLMLAHATCAGLPAAGCACQSAESCIPDGGTVRFWPPGPATRPIKATAPSKGAKPIAIILLLFAIPFSSLALRMISAHCTTRQDRCSDYP